MAVALRVDVNDVVQQRVLAPSMRRAGTKEIG